MRTSQITSNTYNLKNNNNLKPKSYTNNSTTFRAIPVETSLYRKFMDPIEEQIANGFGKLLKTRIARKIISKTEEYEAKQSNSAKLLGKEYQSNLYSHLIVLGSTFMSGFYVLKTLKNNRMEEKKRRTLAINQAIVFGVSTVMAYTFDGMVKSKVKNIRANFEKIVANEYPELDIKKIKNYSKGINIASKIMIFGMIYRFLAPVLVTPFANAIGNKLNEKKTLNNKTIAN